MHRNTIEIAQLTLKPHHLFDEQWALLTAGDYAEGNFNTMTIGWGAIGTMWSKPFAFVAVRHSRYTYEFMEKYDSFTLAAFPGKYKKALDVLGTKSGRDIDKYRTTGLTPIPSTQISSPGFDEAELIIECRKSYWQDLDPTHFLLRSIPAQYPQKDYHRVYFGEIVAIFATDKYLD